MQKTLYQGYEPDPEQFLVRERQADYRSEYIDGMLRSMAGASENHNLLCSNLLLALGRLLESKNYHVFANDMRVQVEEALAYLYPDIVITCGRRLFLDTQRDTLLNPIAIGEILSKRTEKYDRSTKFELYRKIRSLREFFLVSQHEMLIELFRRSHNGQWEKHTYSSAADKLHLISTDSRIALKKIYTEIVFADRR